MTTTSSDDGPVNALYVYNFIGDDLTRFNFFLWLQELEYEPAQGAAWDNVEVILFSAEEHNLFMAKIAQLKFSFRCIARFERDQLDKSFLYRLEKNAPLHVDMVDSDMAELYFG